MLKKLKSKRIIAFFLLMITLLSTTQPIFAASGTGKWVGGQFASFIKTTDNANTQYGVLLRRLINYSTNEQRTVFCAEQSFPRDDKPQPLQQWLPAKRHQDQASGQG